MEKGARIIKVSILHEKGKLTVPKEIRILWDALDKKAKVIWYEKDGKIWVEKLEEVRFETRRV
jgi:bifunctional DNA-binding transcriptional regulator/antitoxin component of YhaV-PrlF toxin-antitoxin module